MIISHRSLLIPFAGALVLLAVVIGCDALLTAPTPAGDVFDAPLEGLSTDQLAAFARGDKAFSHLFGTVEGLGPIFNQPSCERCHAGDGRGNPRTILIRFGRTAGPITDPILSEGGPQLQDHSIPGVQPEVLPAGVAESPRTGPPIFGIGLIEAIQDSEILKYEDPLDLDGDGISGKANRVAAPDYVGGGTGHLGRFGRKAGVAFLLQQVVNAYHQDIGITTDFLPIENGHPQSGGVVRDDAADPELPASVVQDVVFYVRTLAPPARGERTSSVLRGETVFNEVGCASCHVPSMRTGPNPVAALAGKNVVLYSDLLLHDMGPDLADNLNEGSATGTEWRTAPLWGLRLVGEFLGGNPSYLHDGRASDLTQAIQFHKGEADSARTRFFLRTTSDRQALLDFLGSL